MVAGVTYEEALIAFKALPGRKEASNYYTTHREIEQMLAHFNVRTSRMKFDSWRALSVHSIVKVNPDKSGRSWHWVVFDAGRAEAVIHDPKPGKRHLIRDFRGLRGNGYLIAAAG
ncbi:hypothetical protein CR920_19790 [Stenotrophomonas indicatrix]|nr:hypothetical protein [Stenotrophomonas indicatrix]PII14082.1 hypothetical protein CR920_19790 [Stenotrophomonas indicatrix]